MKSLSFIVIVLSILGMCFTEEHSPTDYRDILQKLSKSVGSEEGLTSLVPEAKKLLEQLEQFCIIGNHNISISAKCCTDMKIVLFSFIKGDQWAIKMLDSFGKPPSGIMTGNIVYPGDYKECKSVSVSSFAPKYCQANIPVHVKNVPPNVNFVFGLCFPDSCSVADNEQLFKEGLHMLPYHLGDKINATVHCPKEIVLDTKGIIAITVCSVLLAFILLGTLYDVLFIQMVGTEKLTINSDDSDELQDNEIQVDSNVALLQPAPSRVFGCLKKFLLCFSILKNIEKLLKTKLSDQSLPSVHGIRFLSMTWVILGHSYFFGIGTVGNPLTLLDMSKRFTFQAIMTGIYSVDTFFLLSGMLVAYGTLNVLTDKGKMNWLYFYVHRFYRLTPTYAVLLMIYVCLLKYFGSGPYWNYAEHNDGCSENWWRNFLYSNNFVSNGGCMGWTWYLANDMQFYIISPILVILLHKLPKFGISLTMVLMCVQFTVTAVLITRDKIKSPSNPNYMDLYMKPYYRIGPYLVGILLGYILHITKCKQTLNKIFVAVMWLVSTVIALAVVYGLYKSNTGESLSLPVATLYWTLSHTVWAVCVAWVIFACCSGYGGFVNQFLSWKAFIPLSRLTYCAYLIHPMVMIVYYFNLPYPTVITDTIESYLFIGHLVMSYGFAFLASMVIEAPLLKIEAIFFHKKE